MNDKRGRIAAVAALCVGFVSAFSAPAISFNNADYTPIVPSGGAVVPGEWNSDIAAGQAYADGNNVPMLAIGGSATCSHCRAMQTACNTDEFKAWAAAKKIVMVFGEDDNTRQKCKPSDSSSLPFVWIYWKKPDGSVVEQKFTGTMDTMPSTEGATLAAQLINSCEMYMGAYPQLAGFEYLAFTANYANARLEAEVGFTRYVDVPLVRDSFLAGYSGTNLFTAVFKGAAIVDRQVIWDPAATEMSVRVDVPGGAAAGDEIDVSLKSYDGEDRGSVKIFVVGERENSTKNPFFIGERTAQTLGYGEWTMDLDVAMEKYRSEPGAHLLAVASGSLWCPDCVMTDAHVLEADAFKSWAVDNKVILVDLDVPNFPNTTNSACLLTRVVARTSDGYISGRKTLPPDELQRYQSGAGYLSRHMVSDAEAAAVLERSRSLVGQNTLNGGWNNPDRKNQNRTGIPNFFALDRSGTLVGTFETFDAIGPSEFKGAYLKRFSELIALEDGDGSDFPNRCWQTTKDLYTGTDTASGTLSAIDLVDTFAFAPISSSAMTQEILVSGVDPTVSVTVNLISVFRDKVTTVATAKGRLVDGVGVSCTMTPKETYYVQIVGVAEGALAVDSEAADTTVGYSLYGTRTVIDNPYSNEWLTKAVKTTLPLYAADGVGVAGYLELQLKKSGKVSVKVFDTVRRVAVLNGSWCEDISADGTATVLLQKDGLAVSLTIYADGTVSAGISGRLSMESAICELEDGYGDWVGKYAIALPLLDASGLFCGDAYMTLSMASGKVAKSSGKMNFAVYLPDGKKLSGTTYVTGYDANFGIVPVVKSAGANSFSACLLVRRNAEAAPSRRAVIAADGTKAVWQGSGFSRECGVYGSLIVKSDSLLEQSNAETVVFSADATSALTSEKYGTLTGIVYDGGTMNISADDIAPAVSAKGFTFRLNRSTGIFKGRAKMLFSGKDNVSAVFSGVILPGWFSDCECQEDGDTVVPMTFLPLGVGQFVFGDYVNGSRTKRSIPMSLRSFTGE